MNNVDKPGTTSFESLGLTKPKQAPAQPKLGQEDFMKLMTTQMNNQDPFKPMEDGQFLSQMAQFSAVTGLKDIKDSFKTLTDAMQSNQALQASSMVGRRVLIPGSSAGLPDKGNLSGAVELPTSTSNLTVHILDASGAEVESLELGSQKEGLVNFKWDGMREVAGKDGAPASRERAAPGSYTIRAEMEVDGKPQAIQALTVDTIDSVSLGKQGQGMTLNLAHGGSAQMSDIKQIM